MRQIELTDNEIYYLARLMMSLYENEGNKYAESIYNKTKVYLDEIYAKVNIEIDFTKEYNCQWVGATPIESPSNDEYKKQAEVSNKKIKSESNYMNELLKKYWRNR